MAETVVLIHIMCVGWMCRTAIDIDYFYGGNWWHSGICSSYFWVGARSNNEGVVL